MNDCTDIQSGAYMLLYETAHLLNELGIRYIVVGGWSPYLLNSFPIPHPGTKDVDVLFDGAYEKGKLRDVIEAFLKNGFILSAKHDFQLFKTIRVSGREFIYNVDLLHPLETVKPNDVYVEHIDLDIPADRYKNKTFKMKSIALPNSQSLFNNNLVTIFELRIQNESGKSISENIPLMAEIGTLITKAKSVSIEKRYRDSLDIFLTIKQSINFSLLIESVKHLREVDIITYNTLYGIREAYDNKIILNNTLKFINNLDVEEFNQTFKIFFEESGLTNQATI